jgi:predicted nucleic acid-binding protein
MTVLLDPSIVIAAADRSDVNHAAAVAWFGAVTEPLAISALALAECDHVLRRSLGPAAADAFLAALDSGAIDLVAPGRADLARARVLRSTSDPRLPLPDVVNVAIVERLGMRCIATFDRSPYSVLRPHGRVRFGLEP